MKHPIRLTLPRDTDAVLGCDDLEAALACFVERLGFRLEAIFPADQPRVAEVSGFGLRVRLEHGAPRAPRLLRDEPPAFVLTRGSDARPWGDGRAGMQYRDLLPDRLGGKLIASQIRIPAGGPVPDYVHHHAVRFQMIYCRRGWVRVVYEDQGEPFVLNVGDCVLQPPHIRHRVLECSEGLEVIELGSPAEHETRVDHELELPTRALRPRREFDGQRFVRHQAEQASWVPWRIAGYECRDTGIAEATGGLAGLRVVRPRGDASVGVQVRGAELSFLFVLQGEVSLLRPAQPTERLGPDDALVVPGHLAHALEQPTAQLELLELTLPAD